MKEIPLCNSVFWPTVNLGSESKSNMPVVPVSPEHVLKCYLLPHWHTVRANVLRIRSVNGDALLIVPLTIKQFFDVSPPLWLLLHAFDDRWTFDTRRTFVTMNCKMSLSKSNLSHGFCFCSCLLSTVNWCHCAERFRNYFLQSVCGGYLNGWSEHISIGQVLARRYILRTVKTRAADAVKNARLNDVFVA